MADTQPKEIPAVRDNPDAQRLEVLTPLGTAYAQYRLTPGTITFTHTLVPEALRGKGIGSLLIEAGLAMARERALKVIPVCPFFKAHMRAHPDTHDLLSAEGRAELAR
jgi:predicted GNAT family acetyltransferase